MKNDDFQLKTDDISIETDDNLLKTDDISIETDDNLLKTDDISIEFPPQVRTRKRSSSAAPQASSRVS